MSAKNQAISELLLRDFDEEFGFTARHGGHADAAAVGLDGAFDDGKSKSGAFNFLLRVMFFHPEEAAENMSEVSTGNSNPVVRDPDVDLVGEVCAADFKLKPVVGVLFESIFDQIEKYLSPIKAISLHHQIRVWHVDINFRLLFADDRLKAL